MTGNKKAFIATGAIVFCLLKTVLSLFALYYMWLFFALNSSFTWAYNAEYEEYKGEFCVIRDFVTGQYGDGENYDFSVNYDKETASYRLSNSEATSYIKLPDDVSEALDEIAKNAFPYKDSYLDGISIQGKRVAFYCKGRYALIYSPSGRPGYMLTPDERDINTRKILFSGGWYHVVYD